MKQDSVKDNYPEMRSEPRKADHPYSSVEFYVEALKMFYHCKVRDASSNGLCILIRSDSKVLDHLKIGQQIQLKLYGNDVETVMESKSTEIRQITRQEDGRYRGHVLVGLSIH